MAKKLYQVKVKVGEDMEGLAIRKSFYGRTKKEARAKGEEYVQKLKTGQLANEQITFEAWAEKYLDTYVTGVTEVTRKDTYENTVRNHLIPHFGSFKLAYIKPVDVQQYFNKIKKLSFSQIHKCDFILRQIFESAVDNDLIPKNPHRNIKIPPGKPTKERPVYTAEQAQIHIEYAKTHPYGLLSVLPLKTSVSRSEAAGLMINDFDQGSHTLHIRRGMDRLKEIGPGKTKNRTRMVPYDQEFAVMVADHKPKGLYVFGDDKGRPIGPDKLATLYEVFRDDLLAYCAKNGIKMPRLTYHELRHTYATLLNEQGVPDNTIALLMGHGKKAEITNEVYIHQNMTHIKSVLGIGKTTQKVGQK